jgi:hypothetical protein
MLDFKLFWPVSQSPENQLKGREKEERGMNEGRKSGKDFQKNHSGLFPTRSSLCLSLCLSLILPLIICFLFAINWLL